MVADHNGKDSRGDYMFHIGENKINRPTRARDVIVSG